MSFTLSQSGMVIYQQKIGKLKPGESMKGLETDLHYDAHWRRKQIISAIGAFCTGVVMIVFAVTKFSHGAWFIVLLIPSLVMVFFRIHNHYKRVAAELSAENCQQLTARPVQTVILVDNVHAETIRLVNFARSLNHPGRDLRCDQPGSCGRSAAKMAAPHRRRRTQDHRLTLSPTGKTACPGAHSTSWPPRTSSRAATWSSCGTSPSASSWRSSSASRRRWRRSAGWPAAWPTTSTTCSPSSTGYGELVLRAGSRPDDPAADAGRGDPQGRRAGGRADPAAPGVQPQAGAQPAGARPERASSPDMRARCSAG